MAHHDIPGYVSDDPGYGATPPGSTHEHTDANVWVIAKFGLWLVITALIVHVGIGLMYKMLIERARVTAEQPYPLASTADSPLPAEPRLQQDPAAEIATFRAKEERKLHNYGWVDKEKGTVHIPIDEAMKLAIERGLPARAEDATQPPVTSGLVPSDASSGRVLERR